MAKTNITMARKSVRRNGYQPAYAHPAKYGEIPAHVNKQRVEILNAAEMK